MVRTRSRFRPSRRQSPGSLGKPRGLLHPRVQQVGPEHFGIVCFDCAVSVHGLILLEAN